MTSEDIKHQLIVCLSQDVVQADGSEVFLGDKIVESTTGLNTRAMTMKFDSLNEREIRGTEITTPSDGSRHPSSE